MKNGADAASSRSPTLSTRPSPGGEAGLVAEEGGFVSGEDGLVVEEAELVVEEGGFVSGEDELVAEEGGFVSGEDELVVSERGLVVSPSRARLILRRRSNPYRTGLLATRFTTGPNRSTSCRGAVRPAGISKASNPRANPVRGRMYWLFETAQVSYPAVRSSPGSVGSARNTGRSVVAPCAAG
jgi:hypothetical protein